MTFLLIFFVVSLFIVFCRFLLSITYVQRRGSMGENFVIEKLLKLDPAHYRVLNDLLLPSHNSVGTTQIDQVVVSNYGVFCIETKAYRGWIFGDADQGHWMQILYYHRERFYNPLLQNHTHVMAIEELIKLKYPKIKVVSLVAFPYADWLKVSGTDFVGYTKDIVAKIKSFVAPILTDAQRDEIYTILMNTNNLDENVRKLHNERVRDFKKT